MEVMELAMNRVPLLQDTGIRTFFNGPESYSHDGRFTLGEAPNLKGYFILAGVNSTGIQSGPGAGRALADWIMQGHPPMDLAEMDPARIEDFQARDPYLQQRCAETLVLTYAMHWPGRQRQSVRNIRRTPFYHCMKAHGAVYAEAQGWERPGWFAPEGVTADYDHSFYKPSWFEHSLSEQKTARTAVAMIDYSMLGKLMVEGTDAEAFLNRVCTNDMTMRIGNVCYSLMLNQRGGVESDVTVARHGTNTFMLMSSISHTRRDRDYLASQIKPQEKVTLKDVTASYGVLSVCGPRSRELMDSITDIDMSNDAFPFNTWQTFTIGHAEVFAQRLSYTGETGWEIFITPDFAEHVFEVIYNAGQNFDLKLVGSEALNALRIEKGFIHWGHDVAYTEAPHQIGLDFICKPEKPISFIGRDAYLKRKQENNGPFLCSIKLQNPDTLLHHNEPVLHNGDVVGFVTSGAFAYATGAAIGLCYVSLPTDQTKPLSSPLEGVYEVMVEGTKYQGTVYRLSAALGFTHRFP